MTIHKELRDDGGQGVNDIVKLETSSLNQLGLSGELRKFFDPV